MSSMDSTKESELFSSKICESKALPPSSENKFSKLSCPTYCSVKQGVLHGEHDAVLKLTAGKTWFLSTGLTNVPSPFDEDDCTT